MSFCPYCGHQNLATSLACSRCGERLPSASRAPAMAAPQAAREGSFASVGVTPWGPQSSAAGSNQTASVSPWGPSHGAATPHAQGGPSPHLQGGGQATQFLDARQFEAERARELALPTSRLQGRVKLVVEQGLLLGEQFLLTDPTQMIGRIDRDSGYCPDIDLSAQDPNYVHRRHARLQFQQDGERLSVTDMGGRNGAYVNNQPLPRNGTVALKLGDKIRIGRVVMRLVLAPEVEGG